MTLHSERHGSTRLLTVDRPEARNAIDGELARAIAAEVDQASRDEEVHAVVLAARGKVFLAGGDLKQLAALPLDVDGADEVLRLGSALESIERCAVPVIAAVNGAVLGGGAELLLMCDLLVMEQHATIRFVHARMGLSPAWGGATRLAEKIGKPRAARALLSAEPIGAEQALAFGLCSRVVDAGQARSAALAIGDELGGLPRASLVAIKRALAAPTHDRAKRFELEQMAFRSVWASPAHVAAMAAFAERESTRGR